MPLTESQLTSTHTLVPLSVLSSTKIESRTTSLISSLGTPSAAAGSKPLLFALKAKTKTASKLISIVEIAKRELAASGISCYQYNVLSSETVEIPRQTAKARVEGSGDAQGEDSDEAAFETMGQPRGTHKRRDVPVLTVYLARDEVKALGREVGEQGA